MASPRFTYISGPDDFLVSRLAKERWKAMTAEIEDDFSAEVVNGNAVKVEEVEAVVNQFRTAAQTMGLFGGRRVIWVNGISFLADNVTGRAESTQKLCEDLKEILAALDPAEVGVLLSASPVDRRKRFPKWLEKEGEYIAAGGMDSRGKGVESLVALAREECASLGVAIDGPTLEILIAKVNGNTRLLMEELRKLATYLGEDGGDISTDLIAELVPAFGAGDFFEATEAFFSRNLEWMIAALRRHFFAGNDARPIIASLQNRNRLLIQLKALVDGGEIALSSRGISKPAFEKAAERYTAFYEGLSDKSNYNVFTQNLWYLGKLAGSSGVSLKRLVDHQLEFVSAFEEIVKRPHEQEEALRTMAIRCLA